MLNYKGYIGHVEFDDEAEIFTGKFNLRLPPELHREAFVAAKESGQSLNSWVCDILRHAV